LDTPSYVFMEWYLVKRRDNLIPSPYVKTSHSQTIILPKLNAFASFDPP